MTSLSDPALASTLYARIRNTGWLVLIRALRATGDAAAADTEITRVERSPDESAISAIYLHLAKAEAAESTDAASQAYEASLAAATSGGAPADIAEVVVSYGSMLIRAGQVAKATTVVGRATEWADQDFACAVLQARVYLALHQPEAFAWALADARRLAGERPLPDDLRAAATRLP
jgi:Flp pilus assembly protein TadD